MVKHVALLALVACGSTPAPTPPSLEAVIAPVPVLAADTGMLEAPAPPASVAEAPSPTPPAAIPTPDIAGVDAVPLVHFRLKRGESLAHFARWSGLPVEVVAEASGLDLNGVYPVGTEVMLPLAAEPRAQLELKRTAHHAARADGYLASRGGPTGTEFYVVRTGDTAWRIANDELGIPVWLLETYNPSVALDALRPGQRLMVPAIADTVADLGDERREP